MGLKTSQKAGLIKKGLTHQERLDSTNSKAGVKKNKDAVLNKIKNRINNQAQESKMQGLIRREAGRNNQNSQDATYTEKSGRNK